MRRDPHASSPACSEVLHGTGGLQGFLADWGCSLPCGLAALLAAAGVTLPPRLQTRADPAATAALRGCLQRSGLHRCLQVGLALAAALCAVVRSCPHCNWTHNPSDSG